MSVIGAWSDLDWDEMERELDRIRHESQGLTDLQAALRRTAGIWRCGDGLRYQQRLRDEWDDRG